MSQLTIHPSFWDATSEFVGILLDQTEKQSQSGGFRLESFIFVLLYVTSE